MLKQEDEYDEGFAYLIWFAEKEFNLGHIDGDYPVLKLFNMVEDSNCKKYKQANDKMMNTNKPTTVK